MHLFRPPQDVGMDMDMDNNGGVYWSPEWATVVIPKVLARLQSCARQAAGSIGLVREDSASGRRLWAPWARGFTSPDWDGSTFTEEYGRELLEGMMAQDTISTETTSNSIGPLLTDTDQTSTSSLSEDPGSRQGESILPKFEIMDEGSGGEEPEPEPVPEPELDPASESESVGLELEEDEVPAPAPARESHPRQKSQSQSMRSEYNTAEDNDNSNSAVFPSDSASQVGQPRRRRLPITRNNAYAHAYTYLVLEDEVEGEEKEKEYAGDDDDNDDDDDSWLASLSLEQLTVLIHNGVDELAKTHMLILELRFLRELSIPHEYISGRGVQDQEILVGFVEEILRDREELLEQLCAVEDVIDNRLRARYSITGDSDAVVRHWPRSGRIWENFLWDVGGMSNVLHGRLLRSRAELMPTR
ncbi:hypothetical protein SLS53_008728 [Cytospora paraplurivora]|uniref:Uncharacterized protein n=1 Tax=Cytospora paraplurivora TaxID=2898453 RepID=A0AAN9TZP4_9PEZI